MENKEIIGKLNLEEVVCITDPCYDTDMWCSGKVNNMLAGTYVCSKTSVYGRVATLEVMHEDYLNESGRHLVEELTEFDIGVDSGQCGIFNYSRYNKDVTKADLNKSMQNKFPVPSWAENFEEDGTERSRFYKVCCNHTLNDKQCGIIDNVGVVSSSGWGDGSYDCYTITDTNINKVVALLVVYIIESSEEELDN